MSVCLCLMCTISRKFLFIFICMLNRPNLCFLSIIKESLWIELVGMEWNSCTCDCTEVIIAVIFDYTNEKHSRIEGANH